MRIFNMGVYICPKMKVSIKSYTMPYQSKIKLHKKITWRRKNQTMWCDRYDSDNHFLHGHLIFFYVSIWDSGEFIKPINVAVQKCTYLPMYIQDPASDGHTPTAMSSQSWWSAGSTWYCANIRPSSESKAKIRARSPLSLCVYSTPGCSRLAAKPEASFIWISGTMLKFLPRPKTVTLIEFFIMSVPWIHEPPGRKRPVFEFYYKWSASLTDVFPLNSSF